MRPPSPASSLHSSNLNLLGLAQTTGGRPYDQVSRLHRQGVDLDDDHANTDNNNVDAVIENRLFYHPICEITSSVALRR